MLTFRIDRLFAIWPTAEANAARFRVSPADYARFASAAAGDARRELLLCAPVECTEQLPEGVGLVAFDTGHVCSFAVEWALWPGTSLRNS